MNVKSRYLFSDQMLLIWLSLLSCLGAEDNEFVRCSGWWNLGALWRGLWGWVLSFYNLRMHQVRCMLWSLCLVSVLVHSVAQVILADKGISGLLWIFHCSRTRNHFYQGFHLNRSVSRWKRWGGRVAGRKRRNGNSVGKGFWVDAGKEMPRNLWEGQLGQPLS